VVRSSPARPVKAKAVEYVKVCSLYGAGFFYIPGTDTCIKLGGYLRLDTSFSAAGVQDQPAWNGDPGQMNRYRDYFSTRSRLALTVDTLVPSRTRSSREHPYWVRLLRSRRPSTSSKTRTPCPSTFALRVTSDPDRLTTGKPRTERSEVFHRRAACIAI
jgi:hypothetical protein